MRSFVGIVLALCLLVTGLLGSRLSAAPQGRGLLWRAVQSCVLNHEITGAAFPCEAVNTSSGRDSGYAVIRAPLDDAHVIVMPTVRTIGIEADRLRGADAPNYFHLAWMARRFVTTDLARPPAREDYALAVNSRLGRSQDQLHIHVACVRADVKRAVNANLAAIRVRPWMRMKPLAGAPPYRAFFMGNDEFARANIVDLVARGLHIGSGDLDDVTIAVVAVKPDGFVVFARERLPNGYDEPHAEALLDRTCSSYAKK